MTPCCSAPSPWCSGLPFVCPAACVWLQQQGPCQVPARGAKLRAYVRARPRSQLQSGWFTGHSACCDTGVSCTALRTGRCCLSWPTGCLRPACSGCMGSLHMCGHGHAAPYMFCMQYLQQTLLSALTCNLTTCNTGCPHCPACRADPHS
jgi:hypothetical protein